MKEFKGTKGEWWADSNNVIISMPMQVKIAKLNPVEETYTEHKKNARLIAASPDLLYSAQDLLKLIDNDVRIEFPSDTWDKIEALEKAINKALD